MNDDDVLALAAFILIVKNKSKKKRSIWCKQWLMKKNIYSHTNLLKEFKIYPRDWHNYLRMDEATYLNLLSLVTPIIKKTDTIMRKAISPHERLTATLRFLATGRSYEDLKYSTIISPQALSYIIPETCQAIYHVLKQDYLKFPKNEEEWETISNDFEKKWNFPHCLGALDGKHIEIIPPAGSGSYFYNYKQKHSMVLLGIADANYRFILFDFGTNGRVSDGGVLQNTVFFDKLQKNLLNIPKDCQVGDSRKLPYVFVADDAFPLRIDMLKPYRQGDLNCAEKKIFNYRICRARRIIENLFGILAARFRIFYTAINLELEHIESVVRAACALHNFLMLRSNHYATRECFDIENIEDGTTTLGIQSQDSNMGALQRSRVGNATANAKTIRENFMSYFVNEGQVPWQNNCIH